MKWFYELDLRIQYLAGCIVVALLSLVIGTVAAAQWPLPRWLVLLVGLALAAGAGFGIAKLFQKAAEKLKETEFDLRSKNNWYEAIIDAVAFPIHVTDYDMNWIYMNKAFEKLLVARGVIKDRESAYGKPCSQAGADICNTQKCGIKRLQNSRADKAESYFEWCGMSCKQDSSYLRDLNGKVIGYVEIVTDLTSIISVNEYIKTAVAGVAANLKRLADGDLRFDLQLKEADQYSSEVKGEFEGINQGLSQVKTAIEALIADTTMLAEAAVEGDLGKRADVSKHRGDFARVVEGVNNTLDSMMQPLHFASDYIQKMAHGEPLDPIDNRYRGYYGVLMGNLDQVRTALYVLQEETQKLAETAAAGRLEARADVSKLKGGYADILAGFNRVLDAIIEPLNEAGQVLEGLAVNDYTQEMTGSYQGMMKELAERINAVRMMLLSVQDGFIRTAEGDITMLDQYVKIGKLSENDKLIPSMITMSTAIHNLIQEVDGLVKAATAGNLEQRADESKFEGGYRNIISGLNRILDAIVAPIEEASQLLQEMAQGNLCATMQGEYQGSYAVIKDSLNQTVTSLNRILGGISEASDQVASGSKQVSSGSQALSRGATEQASSVEELTSSITQMAAQIKENAVNANQASQLALQAKQSAETGNAHMKEMQKSMAGINEASANISKIIKVIDEIAFQTNILALNAAVEAARAGQHGKGFAVVAEEVRNLAARSASAAKETTALIEGSIKKVEEGTQTADETATALDEIVNSVTKAADLVRNIASASNEQASAIAQINRGIDQVSNVVQTNTATAEESAASSEELSNQAANLKALVSQFRLDNELAAAAEEEPQTGSGWGFGTKDAPDAAAEAAVPAPHREAGSRRPADALNDKEFGKY
jgi:methyl-accepting chemotaxis protein